jgi:hypothetical protein
MEEDNKHTILFMKTIYNVYTKEGRRGIMKAEEEEKKKDQALSSPAGIICTGRPRVLIVSAIQTFSSGEMRLGLMNLIPRSLDSSTVSP